MSWSRFIKYCVHLNDIAFALDISRMDFPDAFFKDTAEAMENAYKAMEELESGAIANPDENRMVGHYWLRNSSLAPSDEIRQDIDNTLEQIIQFARLVHNGEIAGESGSFQNLLIIGIGGSALGPQFVSQALGHPRNNKLAVSFFDNTDPDGIDIVLSRLEGQLGRTLVVVISKSGGTAETRNGMLETKAAYQDAGLSFARHAVAITGVDSKLDRLAAEQGWLERFPMWDWVGGRTSELGPVGLLPALLQGIDIKGLLAGAAAMDAHTRHRDTMQNPAALLALMWYYATDGRGTKDMVVLPYKDRLQLFSRYLQQLVMESLGKELDLSGAVVNQGIAVYGNKGSTDQHAYVQQLREGVPNFFVTFIEVLKHREGPSIEVESDTTSGDFLQGFLLGTRSALYEKGRQSITITIDAVTPFTIGMLIALYERAVGFYAALVGINAYHQPGVEAGKKAAASFIDLNRKILALLKDIPGQSRTAEAIAEELDLPEEKEIIFKLLQHLAANPDKGIRKIEADDFFDSGYLFEP